MTKYLRVWIQLTNCAFSTVASNRIDSICYFIGKIVRFGFFVLMIFSIFRYTDSMAGYKPYEILLFFLTFNLVDLSGQAFMRGVYAFRRYVREGGFDYVISKPVNPLFFILSRSTDLLDLLLIPPIIGLIIYCVHILPIDVTFASVVSYLLLLAIGYVIIMGFHIMAAAVTITHTENANTIWLYRDAMTVGRLPPEIFSFALQMFFTFVIPIFLIVAYPTKALLGELMQKSFSIALVYSILFFSLSLFIWDKSLKKYTSASS